MSLNILDYIIIALLFLSGLNGFRRGFIKTAGSILGTLAGVLVAAVYNDKLAEYLQSHFLLQQLLAKEIKLTILASSGTLGQKIIDNSWANNILNDPSQQIAHLILISFSFIILVISINLICKVIFAAVNHVFAIGGLGGVNRIGGLLTAIIKDLVILVLILGFGYPLVRAGGQMGIQGAVSLFGFIDKSILAGQLLKGFILFKALLGMNV